MSSRSANAFGPLPDNSPSRSEPMHTITLSNDVDFDGWRTAARRLVLDDISPAEVSWRIAGEPSGLFDRGDATAPADVAGSFNVPKAFINLARLAVLHRDGARFDLLYRLLFRLRRDPHLLDVAIDADVSRAEAMAKSVRRDEHKMHAFVRFREITLDCSTRFVAWFEPEHRIVALAAPFFVDRFSNMDWSILTPDLCAHWHERTLSFTSGVAKADAPSEDRIEDIWRSYYASIFNPARLKVKAMQAEMPKKYWRNLPEASLIKPLTEMAERATAAMIGTEAEAPKAARQKREPEMKARPRSGGKLDDLREEAANCRACPLWRNATQTVFGEGPADAEIMFVGEQPGDKEDLAGKPFVGPAGQVFDRALKDAGIKREKTYVTNAVKHFKFVPRGKIRIHQKPATPEIRACRQWYEAELAALKPQLVVALGATAAQSVLGRITTISKVRGELLDTGDGVRALVTVHPSYLLRLPDEAAKSREYARFVADLKIAARMLSKAARAA
jgi:uracil-DNA glycosylase